MPVFEYDKDYPFAAFITNLGKANYSMYLTILRQVVLLIPLSLVAARTGSLNFVWVAFVLAELLALPIGKHLYDNIRKTVSASIAES